MIKPDDVPASLVYDVYAQMKKCLELDELGTPVSTEQQIADLLNLCVEAGLVVPASEAKVLRRALALLRTIRREGYTHGGDGSIAIEQRIKELENLER